MKTEQKDTAEPKTAQEIRAFSKKYSEAYNKHDAAGILWITLLATTTDLLFVGLARAITRWVPVHR